MKARWSHCVDIENALREIMLEGQHAEHIVKKYTSSPNKGSKDRRFIAQAVFTIIKNFRYYEYLAEYAEEELKFKTIISIYLKQHEIISPQGNDWPILDEKIFQFRLDEIEKVHGTRYSMPEWLDEIGLRSLPDHWKEIRRISIETAPIFIRINSIKSDLNKVKRHLETEKIYFEPIDAECIKLLQRINLKTDKAYAAGWFEIQDYGSQQIGRYADPRSGSFVIDACAGAGGKTLHLAAIMQNEGNLLALDVNTKALNQLKLRSERAGATMISVSDYEDKAKINTLVNSADLVLCDVPCSATGVMRREIDHKWKFTEEQLKDLILTQQTILAKASQWVRNGGTLVYATCSVLPQENQDQIMQFLAEHTNFSKVTENQLFPVSDGHDGFYMCRLERTS